MKWWLSVFFLINGTWTPGDKIDQTGWSPRAYATKIECFERKKFAEKYCKQYSTEYQTAWFCSEGKPLNELPAHMHGYPC